MNQQEAKILLEKIRNGDKHYENDYFGAESLTSGYDAGTQKFYINRVDTIVGSYNKKEYYSEEEFLSELKKLYL